MNENSSLETAAGTLLRRVETLATDLRAPSEFSRELADVFAFLTSAEARVLLADNGWSNRARFVVRSLLGDENAEARERVALSAGVTLDIAPTEKFAVAGMPIPADALLLLVEARQQWTHEQDAVFRNAHATGVPVCVVLTGTSGLEESERADVPEYVEKQMRRSGNALLIELNDDSGAKLDATGAAMIRGFLDEALGAKKVAGTRHSVARAAFSAALEKLRPQLEKLRETDAAENRKKDDAIFSVKTAKDGGEQSWRDFERECANYRRRAEKTLREFFSEQKEDIVGDVLHSMENSSSLRDWWEKTFNFLLEKHLKKLMESAAKTLERLFVKDARLLTERASQTFGIHIVFDEKLEQVGISESSVGEAQGGISGSGRIVVRMTSLLAGGALAALLTVSTGGVGALSFLTFGLPNIAAEGLMKSFEGKSRKEAKSKIEQIVRDTVSENEERFCAAAKSAYEELLEALKKARSEWQTKADEKISEMHETPANAELSALREKCETAFAEILAAVEKL